MPEVFIYSSNIGAAKMALEMGVDRHRAFLKKLGLMDRVPTELGDTAAPIVPAHWQKLNTMTIAFGHGLSVTPLQLAAATAAARQWRHRRDPDLPAALARRGHGAGPSCAQARTSASMLKLMRLNVLKGTGKRADADGYRVGGKTGTAEKVVGGHYSTSALLTSFLAAFPTDAPEYVVLVMLDEPQRLPETEQSGHGRRQCRAHRRQDHRPDRAHPRRGAQARGRSAQI